MVLQSHVCILASLECTNFNLIHLLLALDGGGNPFSYWMRQYQLIQAPMCEEQRGSNPDKGRQILDKKSEIEYNINIYINNMPAHAYL